MKLHDMVRNMIGIVNPSITGSLFRSKGYILKGTRQEAVYEDPEPIELQVQSLKGDKLIHGHYASEQNEKRVVYANGQLYGIDRVRGVGGDLLEFLGRRWLVVQRLEEWEMSGWCKVLVVAQLDQPENDQGELVIYADE